MEQLEQMLTQIARHGTRRIGPDDEFVMAPHYFHQVDAGLALGRKARIG